MTAMENHSSKNLLCWTEYEQLLIARYVFDGLSEEASLRFARGEINAIQTGNHWTRGKPTPADPQWLILHALSKDKRGQFTEHADTEIVRRKYSVSEVVPEKPRNVYHGSAAIKQTLAAGIGIKDFYAKNSDNDSSTYTTDVGKIATWWSDERRRFKAFIRGKFLVMDIDRKPGKSDGLEEFYRIFPRETLSEKLQNLPESFPCYVSSPSGGFHLYFKYDGPEFKVRELAPSVEIKEWQITAPGSRKENGEYILYGELDNTPPLYGVIIDAIEKVQWKKEQAKAERSQSRTQVAADRPIQFTKPCITLDDLTDEAVAAYGGNHDRQVSFAGRAYRCKFSEAETLAYVKSHPDIFGNGSDTENTVLSVFRDNGGYL